jgi:hypothetical protein
MIGENEKTIFLSLSTNTGCKPRTESAEDPIKCVRGHYKQSVKIEDEGEEDDQS